MTAPVSPGALVAYRMLLALDLGQDVESARRVLAAAVARQLPKLSPADVRGVLAAVAEGQAVVPDQRKTEVFHPGEMPPRATTPRDNLT